MPASSARPLQSLSNLPATPGRQVKVLRSELEKKENENDELKNSVADLTKALDSLNLVKDKAAAADKLFNKPDDADKKKKKKDDNAPTPAMTAYRYFCEDLKSKGQDTSGDTRQMWKECQGEERKRFTDLAAADKKRFEKENEEYQQEEKALEMYYEKQKQELAMEFFEAHLQAQSALVENEKKKKKEKDPDAPKKSKSAYLYFCQENRDSIVKKNPDANATEILKILGEEWGKLNKGNGGKNGTKKYDTMAAKDKARYEKEKAEYDAMKAAGQKKVEEEREMELQKDKEEALKLLMEMQKENPVPEPVSTEDSKSKPKKTKKTKPSGPKKPSSAYIFFTKENRAKIQVGMPENTTQQELLSEVGRQWRELSDAKKKKYNKMAEKDKERYNQELEQMKSEAK